jgi:NADPH2:quinone reductase
MNEVARGGTGASGRVTLPRSLMVLNATIEVVLVYTMPDSAQHAAVAAITDALRRGRLTTLRLYRFPLSETRAAHYAVENGALGKVLIDTL